VEQAAEYRNRDGCHRDKVREMLGISPVFEEAEGSGSVPRMQRSALAVRC
jgi:hypothetical protein